MILLQPGSAQVENNPSFFQNRKSQFVFGRGYNKHGEERFETPALWDRGGPIIARKMESNSTCLYAVIIQVEALAYTPNGARFNHIHYTGWSTMAIVSSDLSTDWQRVQSNAQTLQLVPVTQ